MTLELGHLCGSPEEVVKIKRDVIVHFDEELSFLASLPTVLETPSFVFMYGGLRDRCIADNRKRSVMELTKYDRFMETEQAGSADSININWASCDVEVLHTEGSLHISATSRPAKRPGCRRTISTTAAAVTTTPTMCCRSPWRRARAAAVTPAGCIGQKGWRCGPVFRHVCRDGRRQRSDKAAKSGAM